MTITQQLNTDSELGQIVWTYGSYSGGYNPDGANATVTDPGITCQVVQGIKNATFKCATCHSLVPLSEPHALRRYRYLADRYCLNCVTSDKAAAMSVDVPCYLDIEMARLKMESQKEASDGDQ